MILRRFTEADAPLLAELHGNPEVMRHIGAPEPRAEVEFSTLPAVLREYDELPEGMGRFVVAAPDFAGWAALEPATSAGLDPEDVELGYRLLPAQWGRGLATEATRLLVRRAFEELALPKVVATTMAVNGASRRVLEKAGLKQARTFHADWPDPLPGAEEGDVVYELTKEEWRTATT